MDLYESEFALKDTKDPRRTVLVQHKAERKVLQWAVLEDTPSGGLLSICNVGNVVEATRRAFIEAHWLREISADDL